MNGRMLDVERPNGVSSTYTFDPAGNLLSLAHDSLIEQLASYVYEYDAVGNRLSVAESG